MRNKKRTYIFITILWILFIWIHSMMSGEQSSNESGFVLGVLKNIFSVFGMGEFITEHMVRKFAHYTEYLILGLLLISDVMHLYRATWKYVGIPLYIGLLVPVIDETIQIFSEGRGSYLGDVWIDYAGVLSGIIIIILIDKIKNRYNKKCL